MSNMGMLGGMGQPPMGNGPMQAYQAPPPMGLPGATPAQGVPAPALGPPPPGAGAPPVPSMLHDVTVVRRYKYGCCRVEPVPPEEFGVSRQAKLGRPLNYCFHEVRKTEADLITAGYDADQIRDLPTAGLAQTTEEASRDTVDESQTASSDVNKANRLIVVTEHYAILDYDGDDKFRMYKVTTAGDTDGVILKRDGKPDIEPVDFEPFAAMTPFIMTHRFFGKSVADLVLDIQRIKTSLLRGMLDNVTLANNQRLEVAEEFTGPKTLDDILNNRPGGIVRTRKPGGLLPIPNQPIGDFAFPMMEYIDQVREWRTGVVRQGQGIDADALQNQSATAVQKVYSAAQAKMKLIARIMAETGFKDMFAKIHATVRKNETKLQTVQLRNKWVPVNPREWKKRDDLTISVGLGSGGKTEQLVFWGQVLNIQKEAIMLPGQNIVKPVNIYNTLKKFLELGGEKAIEPYFSDPADPQNPVQPPPPDPKMLEVQGKLQMQDKQMQGDQQMATMKFQSEQQIMNAKAGIEKVQSDADIATQDRKTQAEMALAQQKFQLEAELMRMDAQIKMAEHQADMAARNHDADIKQKQSDAAIEATKAKAKAQPAKPAK